MTKVKEIQATAEEIKEIKMIAKEAEKFASANIKFCNDFNYCMITQHKQIKANYKATRNALSKTHFHTLFDDFLANEVLNIIENDSFYDYNDYYSNFIDCYADIKKADQIIKHDFEYEISLFNLLFGWNINYACLIMYNLLYSRYFYKPNEFKIKIKEKPLIVYY